MNKFYLGILIVLFSASPIFSQNTQILNQAKNYLSSKAPELGLTSSDLSDLTVQTNYTNDKTNLEYAYLQQNWQGVPVYNAIANFVLKNGSVVYMTETFQKDISHRLANQSANENLEEFAGGIAQNMGYAWDDTAFLNSDYTNQIVYFATEDGKLNKSWVIHLNVSAETGFQILEIIANAQTGEVYSTQDMLLNCYYDTDSFSNPMTERKLSSNIQWLQNQYAASPLLNDGAQYMVYELPVEAPTFGDRSLVVNPADPLASPFGWHDIDGVEGHDFTTTQGNNVIAVNDQNSAGLNWIWNGGSYQFDGFADGGEDLDFVFPLDLEADLYNSPDASTTNLFYMNNMMHDVFYHYGFDEASGNFQYNNYDRGGVGNDEVFAFGQTGESMGMMNNAMFGTPPEGQNPYMIMFMWDTGSGGDNDLLGINTAGPYEGGYYGIQAEFGANLPNPSITKDLVVAIDDDANGGTDPYDACENITNAAQLNGKIAMIRRGSCDFVIKVKNAQNAGAVAVVMVNNVSGNPIAMGGTDPTINIPSVMIRMNDGDTLMDVLLDGGTLNGSVPKIGHTNGYKDGDFDNGIIAHEYTHGISNRLTGGAFNAGCLNNEEQMGEGWSDWAGLILTIEPGDTGADPRGIGTYAMSQPTTGPGIRPYRYSTNMSVNPVTYDFIKANSQVHSVGFVWAQMIWDMTWDLIDVYGWDPDNIYGSGGNNVALELVTEGMKLQPCNPGFVSGRDGILEADELLYEGANQCAIWSAFARRGLGYSASQGSPFSTSDGVQAFDMPPQEVLNCDLGVTDLSLSGLSLYPNPTQGEFYLLTEKPYKDTKVVIRDLTGNAVYKSELDMSTQRGAVQIEGLPAGIYVVSIETPDGTFTKKLIKK